MFYFYVLPPNLFFFYRFKSRLLNIRSRSTFMHQFLKLKWKPIFFIKLLRTIYTYYLYIPILCICVKFLNLCKKTIIYLKLFKTFQTSRLRNEWFFQGRVNRCKVRSCKNKISALLPTIIVVFNSYNNY